MPATLLLFDRDDLTNTVGRIDHEFICTEVEFLASCSCSSFLQALPIFQGETSPALRGNRAFRGPGFYSGAKKPSDGIGARTDGIWQSYSYVTEI